MCLADDSIGEVTARLGENTRRHTGTRNRPVADDARIQIAVDRKRQRTRDGRCRHNEQIGTGALRAQGVALADAKPVLLICDHKRKICICRFFLNQRMRSYNQGILIQF